MKFWITGYVLMLCVAAAEAAERPVVVALPQIFWRSNQWQVFKDGVWMPHTDAVSAATTSISTNVITSDATNVVVTAAPPVESIVRTDSYWVPGIGYRIPNGYWIPNAQPFSIDPRPLLPSIGDFGKPDPALVKQLPKTHLDSNGPGQNNADMGPPQQWFPSRPHDQESDFDFGQPKVSFGQPNVGIGQPNVGIGQPNVGIGQPNVGIGQPNVGIGQPNMGIGQPNISPVRSP